jgi:signal peptidase I
MPHQSAMQVNVYDHRHRPRSLVGRSEWERWRGRGAWGWHGREDGEYGAEASGRDTWSELRYHHLVPDPEQWEAIRDGTPLPRPPRATLITDFSSYNTNLSREDEDLMNGRGSSWAWMQPHWVGDLTLEATLEVRRAGPGGTVRLELVKAGTPHHCTIDLLSGTATLTRGNDVVGRCETKIRGAGRYRVEFGNVDDRMTLIIDGRPAGPGFAYEPGDATPVPTAADLRPAALAVRDASIRVSDLILKRDIYYAQFPGRTDYDDAWTGPRPGSPIELFDFLSSPSLFGVVGRSRSSDYSIGPNGYLVLGDNSPRSRDGRAWGTRDSSWRHTDRPAWEVPGQLLVGKAFFVYWPHAVPFGPRIEVEDSDLLIRPRFEAMRWIR